MISSLQLNCPTITCVVRTYATQRISFPERCKVRVVIESDEQFTRWRPLVVASAWPSRVRHISAMCADLSCNWILSIEVSSWVFTRFKQPPRYPQRSQFSDIYNKLWILVCRVIFPIDTGWVGSSFRDKKVKNSFSWPMHSKVSLCMRIPQNGWLGNSTWIEGSV